MHSLLKSLGLGILVLGTFAHAQEPQEKKPACALRTSDDYRVLLHTITINGEDFHKDSPYRNVIPAFQKIQDLIKEGECTWAYSPKEVCRIRDLTDTVDENDHPTLGKFNLELIVPNSHYTSGKTEITLSAANSREEAEAIGKMISGMGFCQLKKY